MSHDDMPPTGTPSSNTPAITRAGSSPQKILHVDDDEILRMITKTALSRRDLGFDVISCANAQEALNHLKQNTADLFLFDVSMPIVNGLDLLRQIRMDFPHLAQVPTIFISGQETDKIKTDDDLHPVIGYIQKPFSPLTLGAQILSLWSKK